MLLTEVASAVEHSRLIATTLSVGGKSVALLYFSSFLSGAFLRGTSVSARGYGRLGSFLSIQELILIGRAAIVFDRRQFRQSPFSKSIASIEKEPFKFRIGEGWFHRVITRLVSQSVEYSPG
jgi:hypothetical protein